MVKIRFWTQILWTFLANGYWGFPVTRNIYQGPLKAICSPGLNCYSCPAATSFCPIGSLQQLLLGIRFSLQTGQYYFGTFVVGSIGLLGAVFGRFICGWGCPFGLLQEILYKIPSPKFLIYEHLKWLKYATLLLLVIIFPLVLVDEFGLGKPWFCEYLCPAGSLEAGIPMVLLIPDLRSTIGMLYWSKMIILAFFIGWSIVATRPFCRTTCPLGAFYSFFSRYQLIRLKLDDNLCTKCGKCHTVCPVEIKFNESPNSLECVNCMRCMTEGCGFGAISVDIAGYTIGGTVKNVPNPKKAKIF